MFEIDNEETSGDESDTGSSEPPKKPKKEVSWGVLSFTKAKNDDRIPLLPQWDRGSSPWLQKADSVDREPEIWCVSYYY